MRVAIGGLPGTGTTTAAYLLAENTKMLVVSAGETFRQMAREKGISLGDYGRMAEADENIDRELDRRMLEMAKKNDALILEGRLIGALCKKENVAVLGVWLHAPPEIRAARISGRESTDMEKTMHDMLEREKSEHTRYLQFYGIDNRDPQIYDRVIDSHAHNPETIVSMIMEAMG